METSDVFRFIIQLGKSALLIGVVIACVLVIREERKNRKTPWAKEKIMYLKRWREFIEGRSKRKKQLPRIKYKCENCGKKVKQDTTKCPNVAFY